MAAPAVQGGVPPAAPPPPGGAPPPAGNPNAAGAVQQGPAAPQPQVPVVPPHHVQFNLPPGNPPVGPPPPPAGPMLPHYMMPASAHGEVTRFITSLYGNSVARFMASSGTEMANMRNYIADQNGQTLIAHALGVDHGPCAFLTVPPVEGIGGTTKVEVLHCMRQYIQAASLPGAMQNPLQHRTIVFLGDSTQGQLPRMLMEPPPGLPLSFRRSAQDVLTDDAVDQFYTSHDTSSLVVYRRNMATSVCQTVNLVYIPQMWIPAFMEGLSPKDALDRARELQLLYPAADRAQFDYTTVFLKAACVKLGGNSTLREASKMQIPYASPGRPIELQTWAMSQFKNYYPNIGTTQAQATAAPPPANPPMNFAAFGASLATGLAAALSQTTQAQMPVQPVRTPEPWTRIQRREILKCMGRKANVDFDQESPPVWAEFVAEGKTAEDIQRVLRDKFRPDPNDPDADDCIPNVPKQTAKAIKSCLFVPPTLSPETSVQGLLPMATMPLSQADYMDQKTAEEDEELATLVSDHQLEARRARRTKKAKAPRDYYELQDCLKASTMIWSLLFSPDNPYVAQVNALRGALKANKDVFLSHLTPLICAGIIWKLSVATMAFVLAPYDHMDEPPEPSLHFIVAEVRHCVFSTPMQLPREIVSGNGQAVPYGGSPGGTGGGRDDSTFGEKSGGGKGKPAPYRYPYVDQKVKDVLAPFQEYDPRAAFATLIRNETVDMSKLVLQPRHCLEAMTMGVCKKGEQCTYLHEPTIRADPDRVKTFCTTVKPLVDKWIGARPAKKAKK